MFPEGEYMKVAVQVVTKLAGPATPWSEEGNKTQSYRRGPFWWMDHEELLSEAFALCAETNVLSEACSPGAFHERLKGKLLDTQATARRWHEERDVSIDDERVAATEIVATPTPLGTPADSRAKHVHGARSKLMDRLRDAGEEEFLDWAEDQLSSTKMKDLRTLFYGSSREQANLWGKYVRGKRGISGTTTGEGQEARVEDWAARYRWSGDQRSQRFHKHPLVMSADGTTIDVASTLRQPIR